MKKILFICSHLHSGSSSLCELLSSNSRIQKFDNKPYVNPLNLVYLMNRKHKCNNRSAVYMDELLYNHELSIKAAYRECDFIYFLGNPVSSLNMMVSSGMKPLYALRYYTFRLRRLCEMAHRTPGALFLTSSEMSLSNPLIENHLGIKGLTSFEDVLGDVIKECPSDVLKLAEECYEKTCYFLKNSSLVCLNKV